MAALSLADFLQGLHLARFPGMTPGPTPPPSGNVVDEIERALRHEEAEPDDLYTNIGPPRTSQGDIDPTSRGPYVVGRSRSPLRHHWPLEPTTQPLQTPSLTPWQQWRTF